MRLLLDTHVAVWALSYPQHLTETGRNLIADHRNLVFVSVVSIWEIAIKRSLGRPSAPPLAAGDAVAAFGRAGFAMLDITAIHAAAVETLPLLHGDPFDRLLIAQAFTEPMKLLTRDQTLAAYGGPILLV